MSLGKEFEAWSSGMGLNPFEVPERNEVSDHGVLDLVGKRAKQAYIRHQVKLCHDDAKKLLAPPSRQGKTILTGGATLEIHQHQDEQNPAIQLHFNPRETNGREFAAWFEQGRSGLVDDLHLFQDLGNITSHHHVTGEAYTNQPFSEIRDTFSTIRGTLREARNTPQ